MNIIPQLVHVSYEGVIDKKYKDCYEIKVDHVTFLNEDSYLKGTVLDIEEGIVIQTHYLAKNISDERAAYYQLAFQILEEDIEQYQVYMKNINAPEKSIQYKYSSKLQGFYIPQRFKLSKDEKQFNPVPNDDRSYNTAGKVIVEVYHKDVLVKSIPVLIMTSSMSYEDYLKMVNEIVNFRDDLLINENGNVGLFKKWDKKFELIEECLNAIKRPIEYISKNPYNKLKTQPVQEASNKVKKYTEKILLERYLYPYKQKVWSTELIESTFIYEHMAIKSALISIRNKVEKIIKDYEYELTREMNAIEQAKDKYEELSHKKMSEEKKDLINKIDQAVRKYKIIQTGQMSEKLRTDQHLQIVFNVIKRRQMDNYISTLSMEDNRFVFTITSIYKSNLWGLDLNYETYEYKYYDTNTIYEKKFRGRRFNISFETSNIHEIMYLSESIDNVSEGRSFQVDAIIKILGDCEDPIGGKVLSGYKRETKDFTLNIVKLLGVNGTKVKEYSQEEVKIFLERYIFADDGDTLGFIESIDEKQRKLSLVEISKYYSLIDKVDMMLNNSLLKPIKAEKCILRPTQIFIGDLNYRKIYMSLNLLVKNICYSEEYSNQQILLKSTCDVYEIWCLFKLVETLHSKIGFCVENKDEVIKYINDFIHLKKTKGLDSLTILLTKRIEDEKLMQIEIAYEKMIYYNQKEYKTPDYTIKVNYDNKEQIFYLDAKYRNYNAQKGMYEKDIEEVAIIKYIKTFLNTKNFPTASMIMHSHKKDEYVDFGGKIIDREDYNAQLFGDIVLEPHSFGSFYLVPSDIHYLQVFWRLIFEYTMDLHRICWNCGELTNVKEVPKKTQGGNTKYHYKCSKCEEFWVKNHCKNDINHRLIKHVENYHSKKEKTYPWFLYCPECGN